MSIIKEEVAGFGSDNGKVDNNLHLRVMAHRDMKETEYVRKWNEEVLI